MNEFQEELLAWCHRNMGHPYCATGCRFCNCSFCCYDCTGWVWSAYHHVHVPIGSDTGVIAAQARWGGWFRDRHSAEPGDILLFREGSVYDGGPDEHAGIHVIYDGAYTWSYESWGHVGSGLYRRLTSFWNDVVRVPALHAGPDAPPPPPPEEDEVLRVIKGDQSAAMWVTNWLEKRKIKDPAEVNAIIAAGVTNGAPPVTWPQAWVDNIPISV